MGQTISKVANRVVGSSTSSTTSSSKVGSKHIPSIPGKDWTSLGGNNNTIIDPITGFTRGTSPLTPSEERQRQFLEGRHNDMIQRQNERSNTATTRTTIKSTISTTRIPTTSMGSLSSTSTFTETKMPDDLLKFLNDIGPVRTQNTTTSSSGSKGQKIVPTKRPIRVTRMSKYQNKVSNFDKPETVIVDGSVTTATSSSNSNNLSQNPSHDKTRQIVNMPLVNAIPGFETSRTTSFSTKPDIIDPNDIGLTMIQLYGMLSSSSSSSSPSPSDQPSTRTTTAETTNATATTITTTTTTQAVSNISSHNERQQPFIDNAQKYLQIPVMLKDTDGTYIGTYPEQVSKLLGTHRGMIPLDTQTRAKLILQDIYEKETNNHYDTDSNDTDDKNDNTHGSNKQSDEYTEIDLGPKRQRT
jgi:hypothetical protein